MNNKNSIQNLIPIIGMTIGVAIGIMIGFIVNDPELRSNLMGRKEEKKEDGWQVGQQKRRE